MVWAYCSSIPHLSYYYSRTRLWAVSFVIVFKAQYRGTAPTTDEPTSSRVGPISCPFKRIALTHYSVLYSDPCRFTLTLARQRKQKRIEGEQLRCSYGLLPHRLNQSGLCSSNIRGNRTTSVIYSIPPSTLLSSIHISITYSSISQTIGGICVLLMAI